MGIDFYCSHCGHRLSVDESVAGTQVRCPSCRNVVTVPEKPTPGQSGQTGGKTIFCQRCGQQNPENSYKCSRCGFVLHGGGRPRAASADTAMGGLIPYKNVPALLAYYFGVFAILPCVGIPLGITAFILGLIGLRYAYLHPEARGRGHAWAGIVLGGLFAIGYGLFLLFALMAGAFSS